MTFFLNDIIVDHAFIGATIAWSLGNNFLHRRNVAAKCDRKLFVIKIIPYRSLHDVLSKSHKIIVEVFLQIILSRYIDT